MNQHLSRAPVLDNLPGSLVSISYIGSDGLVANLGVVGWLAASSLGFMPIISLLHEQTPSESGTWRGFKPQPAVDRATRETWVGKGPPFLTPRLLLLFSMVPSLSPCDPPLPPHLACTNSAASCCLDSRQILMDEICRIHGLSDPRPPPPPPPQKKEKKRRKAKDPLLARAPLQARLEVANSTCPRPMSVRNIWQVEHVDRFTRLLLQKKEGPPKNDSHWVSLGFPWLGVSLGVPQRLCCNMTFGFRWLPFKQWPRAAAGMGLITLAEYICWEEGDFYWGGATDRGFP